MLEVTGIKDGIVIDHIKANNGLKIFSQLMLSDMNVPVVLVMNVDSSELGKKDIIKIEDKFEMDFNKIGLIDPNITINIIKNDVVVQKHKVILPEVVHGLFKCDNPRCITNCDDYIDPSFKLLKTEDTPEYLCDYCEEITIFNGYKLNR